MLKKTTLMLALMVALMVAFSLVTTSCKAGKAISTTDEMTSILKTIGVGESRYVQIVGELQPYSGSFPKGKGLYEMSVGKTNLLIHSLTPNQGELKPYLNKTVSATVKISNFPLPDSHPASQIQGHWITEIKEISSTDR